MNESRAADTLAGHLLGAKLAVNDGFGIPAEVYEFASKRAAWETIAPLLERASPLRSAHLRDPVGPQIHFASESFMDEVAAAVGAVVILAGIVCQVGLAAAPAGAISLMPSTVSVTEEGGSPSARSQPRATATRIAASTASLFAMPSLVCTLSTCVQVGGGRRPVRSCTAVSREDRNWAGLGDGVAIGRL